MHIYWGEQVEKHPTIDEIMNWEWKLTEAKKEYLEAIMEGLQEKWSKNSKINARRISNFLYNQTEI